MILAITNIVAGLVLGVSILKQAPAIGESLEKASKALAGFQTIIGVIALILGLMYFKGLAGIVAIVAGFVLLTSFMPQIPVIGDKLHDAAKYLGAFQGIIGVIALIVGILTLLA